MKLPKAKFLLLCLLFFILGIFVSTFCRFPSQWFLLFLFSALISGLIFKKHWQWFLIVAFFFFGFWRYQISLVDFNDPNKIYHYNGQKATVRGEVAQVERKIKNQRIVLETQELVLDQKQIKVSGRALLVPALYPEYSVGDYLAVDCQLEKPGIIVFPTSEFDYERYLTPYNIYSLCSFPKIKKISSRKNFGHYLGQVKNQLILALNRAMIEPQVSVVQAMILNNRYATPPELMTAFANVGISHIIAISGGHIVIIAALLANLTIFLGLSRPRAFWPVAACLTFYVILIGAPASAVRSVIMGILLLFAQKIGRANQAINSLVLVAALMLVFNPKLLVFDIGFQLSFLAVLGLMYLAPIFKKIFARFSDFGQIKEMLTMTLSAQIITMPLIVFYFHKLSLSSFLANFLLLPIVPFLTVGGLLLPFLALIWLWPAKVFGFVLSLALSYFLGVVEILNKAPVSFLLIKSFSWPLLILTYGLMVLATIKLGKYFKI